MCIMGILLSGCILLSLSAKVLSIDDSKDGGVGPSSSFPRRGMGDRHGVARAARISRDELKNRPASHVPSMSTLDCDGTMQQHPPLPRAPDDALNFYTIGDWGVRGLPVGSDAQLSVARGMSCVARESPPKFIATLGDNFYPNGVTSIEDQQFVNKFENVYDDASMHVPWYPSIGDHDHCGDVAAQAKYSLRSSRWTMPRAWYTQYINIPGGGGGTVVQLIFVDWVALEGRFTKTPGDRRFHEMLSHAAGPEAADEHWEWLQKVTNKGNPTWRIVLGHRPLLSVSARSERDDMQYPAEANTRRAIRQLMEGADVDLWINGHDHTAQVACSVRDGGSKNRTVTHFMTNGIGGYDLHALRKESEWPQEAKYANSSYHGFGVHRVTRDTIANYFLDDKGNMQHEFVIRKDSTSCS